MANGDLLPDDEIWFRVLIREEFIDGSRISESALKKKAISANPAKRAPRDYDHALSGRRLSLCGDMAAIDAHAVDFAKTAIERRAERGQAADPALTYVGVAFAAAGELRGALTPATRCDVMHTPSTGNEAHAGFVTFGTTDADLNRMRTWLQDRLAISRPGKHPFAITAPTATPSTTVTIVRLP